jgi:hypothetical protein
MINFWSDKWMDERIRLSDLEENIPTTARCWMVKDVALPTGEWNYNLLQSVLPSNIIQKLHAIVPPHDSQGVDIPLCPGTNTGAFTVSAAYHLITGDTTKKIEKKWTQVWKIDSSKRIKVLGLIIIFVPVSSRFFCFSPCIFFYCKLVLVCSNLLVLVP